MKSIQSLCIKYTAILAFCLSTNYYILIHSSINIPEYIPYTPIKIYGFVLVTIFIPMLNLLIREFIKVRNDLSIAYLTFYGTTACFVSEIMFQAYLLRLFPDDGWQDFISGVLITSIFVGIIAFFIAFQLKTRRTGRLISLIIIFMFFFQLLIYFFPAFFLPNQ